MSSRILKLVPAAVLSLAFVSLSPARCLELIPTLLGNLQPLSPH